MSFGAAGERALRDGLCAYTGSAPGSGGFAMVDRHYRIAAGTHDVRYWHVDSLLGHPNARLDADRRSAGLDAECLVADAVRWTTDPVTGIGATDCRCASHLAFAAGRHEPADAVRRAHAVARRRSDA